MSNPNAKKQIETCESAGLQAGTDPVPPQGTPRACNQKGAVLSITAPANSIKNKKILPLRCAIDSLYLSYKGHIAPDMEELLTVLKEMAQHESPEISSEAYLNLADHKFEVSPKGSRQFSFQVKDNWFSIQISKSKTSNRSKLPLAYVQISSELLTFTSLNEILNHLNQIISKIGVITEPPTISRLDLCLDYVPYFDVEDINFRQWRTRASKLNPFYEHRKLTGWQIGSRGIMARLYNKSLEIKKSKKDYLKPLWGQSGWNGQADVWRMEFQVRREVLKNLGLNYPTQIHELSPSLWKYACTQWLELVKPTSDKTTCRWPVSDEWKEITQACTSTECESLKRVSKQRIPKDSYLYVNGIAAFSSFMAREGINDLGEALGEFLNRAKEYHLTAKGQSMEDYLLSKAKEKTLRYNTRLEE